MSQIYISDENPNADTGGCGTLAAGETAGEDQSGPYIIFTAVETSSNISPHAVLSFDEFNEIAPQVAEYLLTKDEPVIEVPEDDVVEVPEDESDIPVI